MRLMSDGAVAAGCLDLLVKEDALDAALESIFLFVDSLEAELVC